MRKIKLHKYIEFIFLDMFQRWSDISQVFIESAIVWVKGQSTEA